MSADPCGCDIEAKHMCQEHKIADLERTIEFLKDTIKDLQEKLTIAATVDKK